MKFSLAFLIAWSTVCAASADAHFLFVRICPAAEGGRGAEVYFSEFATAGDPRYIDRMTNARFWLQTSPGEFRPLEMRPLSDRLRGRLPIGGSLMAGGQWEWGVIARPGQTPFLLRHYPKSVAGQPQDLNRMQAKGTAIEIIPHFEADRVELTAQLDGKPLPKAAFTIVDSDLSVTELKADAQGNAVFKPESPSYYCIYTDHVNPTAGEHDGKKYDEIREFATLSFTWPLVSATADPAAVKLFEEAIASRAVWRDFPGFTAKIEGDVEGRPFSGKVTVAADGGVKLDLADDVLNDWVQDQLESITMHRAASQQPSADRPKPILRFADDQVDHPLGRLLEFQGGQFASSYRVRAGQIATVNRFLNGQDMTITVLDNQKNADGKYLPHCYTVEYWDDASGKLARTETVRDEWSRVGQWDLPASHIVTTSSENGYSVRSLRLSDFQLTDAKSK